MWSEDDEDEDDEDDDDEDDDDVVVEGDHENEDDVEYLFVSPEQKYAFITEFWSRSF